MAELATYLDEQREQFEQDLCELLRIPSVSADSRFRDDVRRAAEWVATQFRMIGLETELIPTAGHPIVFAEYPAILWHRRFVESPTVAVGQT